MIQNPLKNNGMFVTPTSFDDLMDMIENSYHGTEKAIAYQVLMLTNNLCQNIFDKAIVEQS